MRDGWLTEGSSSTVFIVRGGQAGHAAQQSLDPARHVARRGARLAVGWLRRGDPPDRTRRTRHGRRGLDCVRPDAACCRSRRSTAARSATAVRARTWRRTYARWQRHLDEIAATPPLGAHAAALAAGRAVPISADLSEQTLLEFPTDFPIKVMGKADDDFRSLVVGIVTRHFGGLDADRIEERPSSDGPLSVGITVTSCAQRTRRSSTRSYMDLTSCSRCSSRSDRGRSRRARDRARAASRGASVERDVAQRRRPAERRQVCVICEPGVAARIDARKRLEIHRDVEREPVVASGLADAQPDARELALADVDARRIAPRRAPRCPSCATVAMIARSMAVDERAHAEAEPRRGRAAGRPRADRDRDTSPARRDRCARPGCRPARAGARRAHSCPA